MPDQHGRLYFKIRRPDKYYTRVYIDEAIATGTPVAVPDYLQRAIEEVGAVKAEERAMRQHKEAHRLTLWALDYDEDHPDYDLYYKQFLHAIQWGEQIKKNYELQS